MKNICRVCGKKTCYKNLCRIHYRQTRRYGRIIHARFDKNEINNKGTYYEMVLYNKKCQPIITTKFSKNQLKKVKKYLWHLSIHGKLKYVRTKRDISSIYLHQLILGKKKGFEIDHKNGNGLDNLNTNLRFSTHSQNLMNILAKGIYWHKDRKRWKAEVSIKGNHMHLGYFKKKYEALKVRRQAELKYFGRFAYQKE